MEAVGSAGGLRRPLGMLREGARQGERAIQAIQPWTAGIEEGTAFSLAVAFLVVVYDHYEKFDT